MRLTTLASAAVLALSTAAMSQVGQAPSEQKLSPNSAMPDDSAMEMNADNAADVGNTAAAAAPGSPSTALVNSASGAPAAPAHRQR